MRDQLNRNEFFEWKKQRVKELAKTGAKVAEIAKELDMTEDDMYSFLSRNFGGIRRLREEELKDTAEAQAVIDFKKAARTAKYDAPVPRQGVPGSVTQSGDFRGLLKAQENIVLQKYRESLQHDAENILNEFRAEFERQRTALLAELTEELQNERTRILNEFRESIMQEISELTDGLNS